MREARNVPGGSAQDVWRPAEPLGWQDETLDHGPRVRRIMRVLIAPSMRGGDVAATGVPGATGDPTGHRSDVAEPRPRHRARIRSSGLGRRDRVHPVGTDSVPDGRSLDHTRAQVVEWFTDPDAVERRTLDVVS